MNKITLVNSNNFDQLLELIYDYQQFYGVDKPNKNQNKEFFRVLINNPEDARFFIYEHKGEIVGFVTLYFVYSSVSAVKKVLLNDLYVRPTYRNKGIGRSLINYALDWTEKHKDFYSLTWETENLNIEAQYLYDSFPNIQKSSWIHYEIIPK